MVPESTNSQQVLGCKHKKITHWRFIHSNTLVLLTLFSSSSLSLSPVHIPSPKVSEMAQGKATRRLKSLHISTPFFFFLATIWIFIPSIFQPALDKTNRICVCHICDFLICVCCILFPCSPSACCLFKLGWCSRSYTWGCWGTGVCLYPLSKSQPGSLEMCPSILLTVPNSMGLRLGLGGDFIMTRHYFRGISIPVLQM